MEIQKTLCTFTKNKYNRRLKTLTTLLLLFVGKLGFCQYSDSTIDDYKPYLIENERIVGGNTASLSKDKGLTDVDTIKYRLLFIDPDTTSRVFVRKKNVGLTLDLVYSTEAIGLWTIAPAPIGNHWDIYDLKGKLFSSYGFIITQITEVGTSKRKPK